MPTGKRRICGQKLTLWQATTNSPGIHPGYGGVRGQGVARLGRLLVRSIPPARGLIRRMCNRALSWRLGDTTAHLGAHGGKERPAKERRLPMHLAGARRHSGRVGHTAQRAARGRAAPCRQHVRFVAPTRPRAGCRKELDVETLVATRGRHFPLAQLESRLRCPRCGSRRVVVMFEVPANPNAQAAGTSRR
jgi:DNA-directed RNA polymerase subunit RPC12/RpoP